MPPIDYSMRKGCATEEHWGKFIRRNGGSRVAELVPKPAFPNADFLFPQSRVLIELKIIETEFGEQKRIQRAYQGFTTNFELFGQHDFRTQMSYRRALGEVRRPLSGIAKKANRQIRETKKALRLSDWRGLLVCINDNFRLVTPAIVQGLFARILNGSMSSIDGMVYLSNHFVEFPGIPYACLVWSPMYSNPDDESLVEFVNWLGERWNEYMQEVLGTLDYTLMSDDLTLKNVMPVNGPYRRQPWTG
jgi:hypothetical protein